MVPTCRLAWWVFILILASWGLVSAETLKVVSAKSLAIQYENGHELIILSGNPVRMELGKQTIEADRVEYNRDLDRLVLMGHVYYLDTAGQTIRGSFLQLSLADQSMEVLEVNIRSGQVLLKGPDATRAAGRIVLKNGFFTPCLGQSVPDYAFTAKKILLYPGDRVVAYDAWLLIQGQRYLFLPVVAYFLSNRSPRFSLGQDPTNGWTFSASLPYVTAGGLGFTLLRYFQNRGFGFGIDHWGIGAAYEHYSFLYLPPPVGGSTSLLQFGIDYRISTPGWKQSLKINRDDILAPGVTRYDVQVASQSSQDPYVRFSLVGSLNADQAAPPPNLVQKIPEVELAWRRGVRTPSFSASGRVVTGGYRAPSNYQDRAARARGPYASDGRVLVEHIERYTPHSLPLGLSFDAQNQFTGYYYSNGERQVNWSTNARLGGRFGPLTFGLTASRQNTEGQTPFLFDRLPTRHAELLGGQLTLSPTPYLSLSTQLNRDLIRGTYGPLSTRLNLNLQPLSLSLNYARDLEAGRPLSISSSLQLAPRPFSFRANTSYDYAQSTYRPLSLSLSYALARGSISLLQRRDLNNGQALDLRLNAVVRNNNSAFSLQENLDQLHDILSGRAQEIMGPSSLSFNHILYLPGGSKPSTVQVNTANLGLVYAYGGTTLSLTGIYDYVHGLVKSPTLQLSSRVTGLSGDWNLQARMHLPEAGDPHAFLSRASMRGGVDLFPGLSVQGGLTFQRQDPTHAFLGLDNFGLTARFLGVEHTKLYLSMLLSQNFYYPDQVGPLLPKFIITLDRNCWALRFTLNVSSQQAELALVYGGEGAGFSVNSEGFHLPGLGVAQ